MQQLIETTSRRQAVKQAPWACRIVKVCGGYLAFEYEADYQTWKRQK
jgi:hypothetical protein